MLLTALVFLLILSLLVLIHEFGHFIMAKKFNIKVEEFGYGLPPRLWGKKIGETIYSINWLPIGGFVKLYGEDEAGAGAVKIPQSKLPKKNLDRAFFTRPVRQRGAVVVAGVVMNVLLAIFIYYIFLGISGFKTNIPLFPGTKDFTFIGANQEVKVKSFIINNIAPNSPAEKAGLTGCSEKSCLAITKVNGEPIKDIKSFTNFIQEHKGEKLRFEFINLITGERMEKILIPRENPPKDQGALGIQFSADEYFVVSYDTFTQRLISGIVHPLSLFIYQFDLLKKLVAISIQERSAEPLGTAVSGPVGIISVVGDIGKFPEIKERILGWLNLAGMLSISLAFFNILPIPALDGGRLFFILIEGISGRKINPKYEALAHTVGMALLLTLILLVTFKDIFQFLL